MTVREAGQKGAEKTARAHSHEFYHEIGEEAEEKKK